VTDINFGANDKAAQFAPIRERKPTISIVLARNIRSRVKPWHQQASSATTGNVSGNPKEFLGT